MSDKVVRVLVVDDSALVRKLLTAILSDDPGAGSRRQRSRDPYEARDKIKGALPGCRDARCRDAQRWMWLDVLAQSGCGAAAHAGGGVVSSLTEASAEITMAALEAGAVDYVSKPKLGVAEGLTDMADELRAKLKAAARARVRQRDQPHATIHKARVELRTTDKIIAIGASTGGTEAVADIMCELAADAPAVLVAQHIPEVFSRRFAERLDRISRVSVSEAEDGAAVLLGHAYVAPGGFHLRLVRSGAKYYCKVTRDELINRHRPAVDALFESVASEARGNAIGVLLTGMGADGAAGLLAMRQAGALTIAQRPRDQRGLGYAG